MIHRLYPARPGKTCPSPRKRAVLTFLVVAAAYVVPGTASGANAPASNVENQGASPPLEDLIVTAHRTPVPSDMAGSSVSVIDRKLIVRRQSIFATDLLRDLPGVAVNRAGSFGSQTQVRVRGAEANHVLVIIDGVEANDPAGANEFDFATLTAFDIESIELVRGPQSALWGSDATAGVINITTHQHTSPGSMDTSAFLEGGSFGTVHGGLRLSAANHRGAFNFGISHLDSVGTKTVASGTEKDGVTNTTVTLRGRWQATNAANIGMFARYTNATAEFDDFDFATGLPADADRQSADELMLVGANLKLGLFEERWQQSFRLTFLETNHQRSREGLHSGFTGAEKLGAYYQSTWQLDEDKHRLVFAVDHETEDFAQRGTAFVFGDPNQDQEMRTTSYMVEYLGQPLTNLTFTASARFDDNSDFGGMTTYRFTSSYLAESTGTQVRATYGTGQKSPTFVERFGFFADQFVGNPLLNSEKSKGFDVGLEQQFMDGHMRAEITYFGETLTDEIDGFAFDPATFSLTARNKDGNSKRNGVELQITAVLSDNFQTRVSYTHTNSTQPNALGQQVREVRRPRHVAAINFNYSLLNQRANINLNVSHTSSQADEIFPPPAFAAQRVLLDEYTLIDLTASYALSPRLTIYARVENLTDTEYGSIFGFVAPGRGAYAGVRMHL